MLGRTIAVLEVLHQCCLDKMFKSDVRRSRGDFETQCLKLFGHCTFKFLLVSCPFP